MPKKPPPGAVGEPISTYEVSPPFPKTRATLGALLKPLASRRAEVRYVLERQGEHHEIFVVLDRDPADLLDSILDVETEIRLRFGDLPFDLRIMTPGSHWRPDDLLSRTTTVYERNPRAGRR